MVRNYYVILGVPLDASREEIRTAYRRLVKTIHPDVSGADSADRFREVQEAWETLGDEARRRSYDFALKRAERSASGPVQAPSAGQRPHRRSSSTFLKEVGDEHSGTYVSGAGGEEIHFGLQMSAAEAATGGEVALRIPVPMRCPECSGLGSWTTLLCRTCRGTGGRTQWRMVTMAVPAGLENGHILLVPLTPIGLPQARLVLHVEIRPSA